jgi:hypothetical protein
MPGNDARGSDHALSCQEVSTTGSYGTGREEMEASQTRREEGRGRVVGLARRGAYSDPDIDYFAVFGKWRGDERVNVELLNATEVGDELGETLD